MTNGYTDIKNTDMMLIMGGNPAENHPCGFKWAIEAKRTRNAKMIVVDPRFTRTAAVSDLFCQIRAGTDIAFLGGMIRYAIENNRIAKDYLLNYTNAAFVVKESFKLPEDDGLFSGFDPQTQTYDKATWNYAKPGAPGGKDNPPALSLPEKVEVDLTLQNPNCVYQLLRKHYSRYTPEMVERTTGVPQDQFLKVADLFTSVRKDGDLTKAATVIYAVGWTQHSFGTQIIRTAAMLQLLLGNVGRAGGGVNALRGHSNIQGATDMAGIFDNLPGYLKVPTPADVNFEAFIKRITPTPSVAANWESFNYWGNTPKFAVSLLKALYGDAATKQNGWAFDYLPKVDRNYSWVNIWDNMYNGIVKGFFAFGMNGVAIGPDTTKNINALKKADWLVVGEIYPDETSEFWRSPGISTDEMKQIQTTVYRLPCTGFAEKDGTFTNSSRWLQWKNAAVPPPGDCRLDQAIVAQIFLKVRDLYKKEGGKFPDPILKLTWNYTDPSNPSLAEVLKEINGKALADLEDPATKQQIKAGQQLPGFAWLKDDGTTSCGNWIYCGSYTEAGNQTARRDNSDPSGLGIHPNWAWSWPANRRVMYNRASCDLQGKPTDVSRRQVWWNEAQQKWVGNDVPDFKVDSKPAEHMGPFIMNPEGVGRIFGPLTAFNDGPFPTYYEPVESPLNRNLLHPGQLHSPVVRRFKTPDDKYDTPKEYNVVCTTYRLTEHYHYWTKNNPMNVQLMPEPFVEIPAEMANEMGIHGGEKVKVYNARGQYIAKAMVTKRIKPMMIDGKKTYQVGIPFHWGYRGIAEDEGRTAKIPANVLTPTIIDPNAYTPEFKGFLVKVEKV
ncbi:MAG: formate dehydrogenase-N subunit alpha [Proteobacteria bacterium]|nr:MAG: formate dehydrogenase-N subunit alpha [Pseudomonadota bacterium]